MVVNKLYSILVLLKCTMGKDEGEIDLLQVLEGSSIAIFWRWIRSIQELIERKNNLENHLQKYLSGYNGQPLLDPQ